MSDNIKNLLSICCLGYKHGVFVKDFLDSFRKVKSNIEIIILDDGSPDDSLEIITKESKQYNYNIKVLSQENTGNIGLNYNRLIREASGEFISFIALDDCLYDDAVDKSLDILKSDDKIAFVASSKITPIDGKKNIVECNELNMKLDSLLNPSVSELLELEYSKFHSFYVQGSFFRKDVIDAVNGFEEDLMGDDIVIRTKVFKYLLSHTDYSFKIVNYPLCYYRFHDSNIHKNSSRQLRIVSEYLEHFWPDRDIPKILEDWYLYMTHNMSLKDSLNLALINKTTCKLLKKDRVISKLEKRIVREHSFLNYVFCKRKIGKQRTITLFSCFSFSYKKNNNC